VDIRRLTAATPAFMVAVWRSIYQQQGGFYEVKMLVQNVLFGSIKNTFFLRWDASIAF
jgi:hypothetical protein